MSQSVSTKTSRRRWLAGPASGTPLTLNGNLQYLACDSKICYPPTSIPVSWQLTVMPLNTIRAPEEIRHK
jgi:hypothetical protein